MITEQRSDSQLKKEAARSVKKSGQSRPSSTPSKQWSESKVQALRPYEYEKHEEAILESMRNQTFVYDINGAAR